MLKDLKVHCAGTRKQKQVREALTKESLSLHLCLSSDEVPEMAKKCLHGTAVMKYLQHISPHARIAARGKT